MWGFLKKLSRKSVSDTKQSEISNDELVTAYEYVTFGGNELPARHTVWRWALYFQFPRDVCVTLRKIGVIN